ncbi:MAG TPA: FAD-dependent oxidoreductase [Steroidobacteraceae bacterium]|jgi:2-polyprenyl-6-methoxyphenol hydroxylase-like FAD-dependent oxidoreductase|nr:FAD-dependent oxidoreductase [Steroidobacteraceae bacterium]
MSDVLIIGAGPTGLVLALWLTKLGVRVRILDKTAEPGTTSRALAVQARTLELYCQLDLADAVVERGHRVPAVNLWARGERAARLGFEVIGAGLTPYAFMEIFPQDEHEQLLIERLAACGVTVERGSELLRFREEADGVRATVRTAQGSEAQLTARYIAGCDGARSLVRETIGAGFPGGTYRQVFYVADIEGAGPPVDGELHVDLDEADFLAVFPLAGTGRVRLVGSVRDERAEHADTLGFEDVSGRAIAHLRLEVRKVNWFSTYHVHHRVASGFVRGRAFILGDAAHIHSPVGGQGMNTGIGDAINLAWKLAAVLAQRAGAELLDSYEPERIAFARRLVATTDRAFSFVTADGSIAQLVRTRIAPVVLSSALSLETVRNFLFRTVSQLALNYRGMPLSEGVAGGVHGGDRLPWAGGGAADNHAPLRSMSWQAHVYGAAAAELRAACAARQLPLHVFPWSSAHAAAALKRDALYLVRPDTYVGLAEPAPTPQVVARYFQAHSLR